MPLVVGVRDGSPFAQSGGQKYMKHLVTAVNADPVKTTDDIQRLAPTFSTEITFKFLPKIVDSTNAKQCSDRRGMCTLKPAKHLWTWGANPWQPTAACPRGCNCYFDWFDKK